MIKKGYIGKLRKKLDFSQAEVAKRIGVSRPTYMLIEKDERELTISQAENLAKVFGIGLNDLLAGREESRNVSIVEEKKVEYKNDDKFEIRVEKKDSEKFKQVLLYVLAKVGARPNVGETVIYKLLYFIDFDYYEKYEENLMGATYIKNHYGPTPVEFKKIVEAMEKNGDLVKVKSKHFQYDQKKYLPLKSPELSALSAREILHINDVLGRLGKKSAKELSDYSHTDTPWMIEEEGAKIRYESVFYRDDNHSVRTYDDEL